MNRNTTTHVLTVLTETSLGQELCSLRKTPTKQNTTHKWTCHADIAEYGIAQGTQISVSIFFRSSSREEEIQATLTHKQLNQEKVGGPSDLHSILLPKLNCLPQLPALLPSAQTSVSYLHHLRHGFIAIVVQRTISVSEVVLEACQVDFVAYVKCQCNGN